jgi:hypothetical protein
MTQQRAPCLRVAAAYRWPAPETRAPFGLTGACRMQLVGHRLGVQAS